MGRGSAFSPLLLVCCTVASSTQDLGIGRSHLRDRGVRVAVLPFGEPLDWSHKNYTPPSANFKSIARGWACAAASSLRRHVFEPLGDLGHSVETFVVVTGDVSILDEDLFLTSFLRSYGSSVRKSVVMLKSHSRVYTFRKTLDLLPQATLSKDGASSSSS